MMSAQRVRMVAACVALALATQACPYRYYRADVSMLRAEQGRPLGARVVLRDRTHVVVNEPRLAGDALVGRRGRCNGPSCESLGSGVSIPLADVTRFEARESEARRATRSIFGTLGFTAAAAASTSLIVLIVLLAGSGGFKFNTSGGGWAAEH